MREIEAIWEKRNLGTTCREIYVEKEDTLEQVQTCLKTVNELYQILFIPIERSDLLLEVQKWDFQYIESNFDLIKKCKNQSIPSAYEKVLEKVSSKCLYGNCRDIFMENLKDKYFFEKDKISIDPCFSQEASANRNYWRMKDFIEGQRDIRAYEVSYGEKPLGFFVLEKKINGIVDLYLSGLYPECRRTNLGICIMGEATREAVRLGAKMITTGVSLNNFSSFKVYQSLQYEILNVTNIFIRHRKEGEACSGEIDVM